MAKKKKKLKMPKLSLVDKLIYWFILLLLILMWFTIVMLPVLTFDAIAFSDESVVAADQKATILWALVSFFSFFLMTFILWLDWYQNRRPIFGIKGFRYGPPHSPKIYPLFMKNKPPVWSSARSRKNRRVAACVLVAILLLSFVPYPLSFFGRNCLHYNGAITEYSVFNSPSKEFTSGQIESVEFATYQYSTGKRIKHWHWSVCVVLKTETGEKYTFNAADFNNAAQGEIDFWLAAMLSLKSRFSPSVITFSGTEKLDKVVKDRNLTEAETALLYQLFDQK